MTDLPILCQELGVAVGEPFRVRGLGTMYIDADGKLRWDSDRRDASMYIPALLDNKTNITRLGVRGRKAEPRLRVVLDGGAFCPVRAHPDDAGLDIFSPVLAMVPGKGSTVIDSGVHVELPKGTVGLLKSRSGLMVRHGITSEGTIDEGYRGSIKVKLFNHSSVDYKIHRGDRITQLIIVPAERPDVELVDSLDPTDRGTGGIGSTGR